jgi:hypothetical protein
LRIPPLLNPSSELAPVLGSGSVVGPAEGAASDGQLVSTSVDQDMDNDNSTRDDTDNNAAGGSLADVDQDQLSMPDSNSTHVDAKGKTSKKRPCSNSTTDTERQESKPSSALAHIAGGKKDQTTTQ